jgi:hypothetical protein
VDKGEARRHEIFLDRLVQLGVDGQHARAQLGDGGDVAGHDAKVAGDGGDEDEVDLRMGGEGRRGRGMKGGGGEG